MQHLLDHVVFERVVTDAGEPIQGLAEGVIGRETSVLPGGDVDAELFLGIVAGADLIGVGPRLHAQPALDPTVFIQRDGQRGLVVDHGNAGYFEHPLRGRIDSQGLGHQLIVVAPVGKVESEEQVQRFAVQGTDREHIRRQLQHQPVLIHCPLDVFRIDLSGTESPGFDGAPTIVSLILVFLEDEIPPVAAEEVPHGRVRLLYALEEVEDRLPIGGQLHLRAEIGIDVEIVG